MELLGSIVSAEGITCTPQKTAEVIAKLCQPQTVLIVHAPFAWGHEQREAFDALKSLLVSSKVMALPDTHKLYKLYTDACDYAVGAILVQWTIKELKHQYGMCQNNSRGHN